MTVSSCTARVTPTCVCVCRDERAKSLFMVPRDYPGKRGNGSLQSLHAQSTSSAATRLGSAERLTDSSVFLRMCELWFIVFLFWLLLYTTDLSRVQLGVENGMHGFGFEPQLGRAAVRIPDGQLAGCGFPVEHRKCQS